MPHFHSAPLTGLFPLLLILAALLPARRAGAQPDQPRGIYLLDNATGTAWNGATLRDGALRNYPFLAGYVLRVAWDFVETGPGVYDFTIIDNIFQKLPAGQSLSLILVPQDPADIAAHAGVTTWTDLDRANNPIVRAVPWDSYLRERRRAFLAALSAHLVAGVPLRDHPRFVAINPYLPGGHTGIRDPNSAHLRDLPGYSRAALRDAVIDELRTLTDCFPRQFVQIGFWKILDSEEGLAAWEDLRQAILAEFDGTTRPRIGFFMENLGASRPAPGAEPVTGYPTTDFGGALYLSRGQAWTAFQALTAWLAPFTGPEKVANATPSDGIAYAYHTFGTTYFELYLPDIEYPAWQAGFTEWSRTLTTGRSTIPWGAWSGYSAE
jgi:hypothetical protein